MASLRHAEITSAQTSSQKDEDIPGLTLGLGDISPAALVTLCIPSFYVTGCQTGQDQGVVFSIYYCPNRTYPGQVIASGSYSFPFTAQRNGRLPISLTGYAPAASNRQPTIIKAAWRVYGSGLQVKIDSLSTLDALLVDSD